MSLSKTVLSAALAAGVALTALPFAAQAQDANPAVGARQGAMSVLGLNLGVLGQMARGNTDYDPEAAQAAADNLVSMSQLDMRFFWPEGTDTDTIEGTRALPAIWAEGSEVGAIWVQFGTAAQGLAAVAGDGLEAMQAAVGPVGAACGACHDDYRQPR